MFQNYFKTAWRNLAKNKFYSSINIAGLSIGLAVGILLLMWVRNELSYDSFHRHADQIYKINSHLGSGSSAQVWEGSPAPLAVFCKQSIPEVLNSVRISPMENQRLFTYGDKKFIENKSAFVDPSFFSVFDFKLLKGDRAKPFRDDHSIILTASAAAKYFGNENPLGKTLVAGKDNFVVTGVLQDFPENSTIQFDLLSPMSLFAKNFGGNGSWKTIDEDLGDYQYNIYLLLEKNTSAETVGKKITRLYLDKRKDEAALLKNNFFALQPLRAVHLVAADGNRTALQTVRIFLFVAILILAIACINYVNLSTARAMSRAKEVSMRKIIGAAKYQLFAQFIMESVLLFCIASLFAFALIYLLLPLYNKLSGENMLFSLASPDPWIVVGSAIAGTLVMAAVYPALLLSSFKPIQALKGKFSLGIANRSFRKALVVVQFVFSVGLIIATIVIGGQLNYIRDKNLGYDKEQVFTFWLRDEMHNHLDAARNELLKQPGILGVAASDNSIIGVGGTTGDTDWDGKESGSMFLIHANGIDKHFIPLLKLKMIAGNNFTGSPADSAHFILNETAVKQAGIRDPIGKRFTLWQTRGTIIGVVKDFNYASLKQAIEPSIFYFDPPNWLMYIKTTGRDASQALAATQKIWRQYSSDFPFNYSFLDEDYNKMYQSDQRTGALFNAFACIAIFISCLGLFGLATYTAQLKTKEIGIRKVLGANVVTITAMLAREFIVLVLIAFIIAAPIGWFAMNKWLQNYTYRISIGWWVFALTAVAAVLIALATVSFQSIRAALANPVKSLRAE